MMDPGHVLSSYYPLLRLIHWNQTSGVPPALKGMVFPVNLSLLVSQMQLVCEDLARGLV